MGHHTKFQNVKMEYEEEGEEPIRKCIPNSRGHIYFVTQYHKIATTCFRITKISLWTQHVSLTTWKS